MFSETNLEKLLSAQEGSAMSSPQSFLRMSTPVYVDGPSYNGLNEVDPLWVLLPWEKMDNGEYMRYRMDGEEIIYNIPESELGSFDATFRDEGYILL